MSCKTTMRQFIGAYSLGADIRNGYTHAMVGDTLDIHTAKHLTQQHALAEFSDVSMHRGISYDIFYCGDIPLDNAEVINKLTDNRLSKSAIEMIISN